MTNTLHAHVSTYSVDCDGPSGDEYIAVMEEQEIASKYGDIKFHDRMVNNAVNSYAMAEGFQGTLTVTHGRLNWSESTDEGGRSREVIFCNDECNINASSHFDAYAEMMGY